MMGMRDGQGGGCTADDTAEDDAEKYTGHEDSLQRGTRD